ncbi:hypothetical protein HMPREF9370_0425, partial [Neisseria wadsworthii 9715]
LRAILLMAMMGYYAEMLMDKNACVLLARVLQIKEVCYMGYSLLKNFTFFLK